MRKSLKISAAVLIFSAVMLQNTYSQSLKNIPYEDPVYRFLEKAYAMKWIGYLPAVRPYTEKRVYSWLGNIMSEYKTSPESFSDIDREELFSHFARLGGERFTLLAQGDENYSFSVNASPYTDTNIVLNRISDFAAVLGTGITADLSAGKNLFFSFETDQYLIFENWAESPYRKFHSPHKPDFNMYTYNLSTGAKGFNHEAKRAEEDLELSIRMNQINQATIDAGVSQISFARNSPDWGKSEFANLALSRTSKPYEYISLDIPFGSSIYLAWMTGFLKETNEMRAEDDLKLVTAHRFEWQVTDWFMLSFYESVVYSRRLELAYINPLSFYYISEVALGDTDNKFGGFDLVFRLPSSQLYFSFFADDWDFDELFKASFFHNIMGITLGYRHYGFVPGLTATAEYTHLNQWMYTHRSHNYVHYTESIGHVLPPNSHIFYFDFRYDMDLRSTAGLSFWFTQRSFGDISLHSSDPEAGGWNMDGLYSDPWDRFYNYLDYGISSAVRETNLDTTLYGEYRIPYFGLSLSLAYSLGYTHNKNREKGEHSWDHYLTLGGKWQAY